VSDAPLTVSDALLTVSDALLTVSDALLTEADWQDQAAAHRRRADEFLEPHLSRRRAGRSHPVFDFLFSYYSLRPS